MSGIAGMIAEHPDRPISPNDLHHMCDLLAHRGRDGRRVLLGTGAALGSVQLAAARATRPRESDFPPAESQNLWVVLDGELHPGQLRQLRAHPGTCPCEHDSVQVVAQLYEKYGPAFAEHLRGQFAVALWDCTERRLVLARDRMGTRPLYWTIADGMLLFASEMKALLLHREVSTELDPEALGQFFLTGFAAAPRTPLRSIHQLPPGSALVVEGGQVRQVRVTRYGAVQFKQEGGQSDLSVEEWQALLGQALRHSVVSRLPEGVPYGSFLSGGLDSTIICALMARHGEKFPVYTAAFTDKYHDESPAARRVADLLGLELTSLVATPQTIADSFPRFLFHAETPVIWTEAVPLLLLAEIASQEVKVVLTGEGADELLGGYPYYKLQAADRLLGKLPAPLRAVAWRILSATGQVPAALLPRPEERAVTEGVLGCFPASFYGFWLLRRTVLPLIAPERRDWLNAERVLSSLPISRVDLAESDPLAQSLKVSTDLLMSNYILGAHGDRVTKAHGLQVRYPFLDDEVVALAERIPSALKLRGLQEKWLLRQFGRTLLPNSVVGRSKKMMTAPLARCFFGPEAPAYVTEALSPSSLKEVGWFDPLEVGRVIRQVKERVRRGDDTLAAYLEQMALVGVLSTQLFYRHFVQGRFQAAGFPTPHKEVASIAISHQHH